jgi:hypothetical protein
VSEGSLPRTVAQGHRYSGVPPLQARTERSCPVRQSVIKLHRDALHIEPSGVG